MDIRAKEQYPELEPFDIVINNAGVQNEEDIDVNLKGTIGITEKYGIRPGIRSVLMLSLIHIWQSQLQLPHLQPPYEIQ